MVGNLLRAIIQVLREFEPLLGSNTRNRWSTPQNGAHGLKVYGGRAMCGQVSCCPLLLLRPGRVPCFMLVMW